MNKILLTCAILFLFANTLKSQVRITMQKEGGVYTTPCTVNGLRLRFIFDTGASNVSLSLSEAIFMIKNGYLDKDDLHGSSYSQIANGDIVENTTINLKELEIGGIKIYNVEATIIHELSAPLLLGQSAIQKLGKIQIEDSELLIMDKDSPSTQSTHEEYVSLCEKGEKYYKDDLYSLAAQTFQKIHDQYPDDIGGYYIYLLGDSYYFCNQYELAIKYFEKVEKIVKEENLLSSIYLGLSQSYLGLKKYDLAILNAQKAIANTKDNSDLRYFYTVLGNIELDRNRLDDAQEYYRKSLKYYLEQHPFTPEEIDSGKIKDETLSNLFHKIGYVCLLQHDNTRSDMFMQRSASLGNEDAKIYCRKYGLKYN